MVPRKKFKMIAVIKVTFRVKSSQGSDKNLRKLGTKKLRESSKELLAISLSFVTISLSFVTCYVYNWYNFEKDTR